MPSPPHPTPVGGAPRIELRRSARRKRTVQAYRQGDAIVVLLPKGLSAADEQRHIDSLVTRILRQEARRHPPADDAEGLLDRARRLSERYLEPQLGRAPLPASVTWVDNQLRRWGSCSIAARDIRLSSRLRRAPEWVQDYVLLHEIVHLVVPHHGPQFQALLAVYPRRERARGYLEGLQAGLTADRPASEGAAAPDSDRAGPGAGDDGVEADGDPDVD